MLESTIFSSRGFTELPDPFNSGRTIPTTRAIQLLPQPRRPGDHGTSPSPTSCLEGLH